MAKGPRPIPGHLMVLRGYAGKRPIPEEIQPEIPMDVPEPPAFLHPYAREEWTRIATECYRLRLLTELDGPSLAAYCQAYAIWRDAVELLAEDAKRDPESRGLLVERTNPSGDTYKVKTPILTAAHNASREMLRYAGAFGLTPVARARIASGLSAFAKPRGKFDGYLAS